MPSKKFLFLLLLVFVGFSAYRLVIAPVPQPIATSPGTEALVSGQIMGTTFAVKVVPGPQETSAQEALETAVWRALRDVDKAMSTYKPNSELMRFNAAPADTAFGLSAATYAVFEQALSVSEACDGAFDITVGPLIDAWGFGPIEQPEDPTPETIAQLRQHVGFEKLSLDAEARTVTKRHPELHVDLSAIAKGFAVDQVALAVEALGYEGYLVEVGGEIRARGHNAKNTPWRLGIEMPDGGGHQEGYQAIVALDGQAMATSGDYRNFRIIDGQRVQHTIDPRTGQPVDHGLASVTVIHPSQASLADAYATAMMVLGPDAAMRLAEAQNLAVMLIVRRSDGRFDTRRNAAFETRLAQSGPR